MLIQLIRDQLSERVTLGRLSVPGLPAMFSVELPKLFGGRLNVPQHTCILPGRYRVTLFHSERMQRYVPILVDVPGRSLIEMHPANKASELLGCIGPGFERVGEEVLRSRDAFGEIYNALICAITRQEKIEIDITEESK